jgi:predicted nicotinamide N-methyase
MLASGVAGLRTGAERIVDDGLDRSRTAAALGAASQAVIDTLGVPQHIVGGIDGIADIVVAEDVTGADDHET